MEFESANPSVVRSINQRDLLNTWPRALRKPQSLPVLSDFRPERIADELADMMAFNVEGEGDVARFVITHEGARLTAVAAERERPGQDRVLDQRDPRGREL